MKMGELILKQLQALAVEMKEMRKEQQNIRDMVKDVTDAILDSWLDEEVPEAGTEIGVLPPPPTPKHSAGVNSKSSNKLPYGDILGPVFNNKRSRRLNVGEIKSFMEELKRAGYKPVFYRGRWPHKPDKPRQTVLVIHEKHKPFVLLSPPYALTDQDRSRDTEVPGKGSGSNHGRWTLTTLPSRKFFSRYYLVTYTDDVIKTIREHLGM